MGASRRPQHNEEGVKVYRVTSAGRDFGGPSYRLLVPAKLARMIGPNREFALEVTDDGLLYRYVSGGDPVELPPVWLR